MFAPKRLCALNALIVAIEASAMSAFVFCGKKPQPQKPRSPMEPVLRDQDNEGRHRKSETGVQMIAVATPLGEFKVWTKRVGNNPDVKVLLLHGGPGATAECFECFDDYLPSAGIEYYYYDQLGSFRSENPADASLWDLDRFVDEVDQVANALGLNSSNFFLYGQSWGGVLAMEYALAHQDKLKGLVISNMMSSIPAYNAYARDVLMPQMDQEKLARVMQLEAAGETETGEYDELLMEIHYVHHVLHRPFAEWPEAVVRSMDHLNKELYVTMQGPSELGASGKLTYWDRTADLERIMVPALVLGGEHDTMDPRFLEFMAQQMPQGESFICPEAGHLGQYDDQEVYFHGLISFLERNA
jgi:proline iminopeptidase